MQLFDFVHLVSLRDGLVNFLIHHGIFKPAITCSGCGNVLNLNRETLTYRCRKRYFIKNSHRKRVSKQCDFTRIAKAGTMFDRCHLDVAAVCKIVASFLLLRHPRDEFLEDELGISHFTVINWMNFCQEGPATRTWYGILDKYIGSKGHSVAIKKVACDQLLFAPTFLAILLTIIGLSQGNDIERLKIKMSNEYSDILINNYKLWPMVQLVNFSLVPLHYQALVVQSVALLWNSYISYRTSLNSIIKHN